MILRKSHLKRAVLVTLVVGLAALAVAGITLAAGNTVTISTAPLRIGEVYYDVDGDGVNDLIGTFPIYDGNEPIVFSWQPYAFASGVNGSYRIALWQNTTPLESTPTWVEKKVSHHWASNPNGATFTMGGFGFDEEICTYCPSKFVVQAETYTLFLDAVTGVYEYEYTPIAAALALNATGPATQTSGEFVFNIFRPGPPEGEGAGGCDPSQPNIESGQWVDVSGDYCSCAADGSAHPAHADPSICLGQVPPRRFGYYLNGPCGCELVD